MTRDEILRKFEAQKNKHLTYSIMLDLAGMATFLLPMIGEGIDILYAPFYGVAIYALYQTKLGKARALAGGFFGAVEELLPFVDIIPTASFMWAYTYKMRHDATFDRFVNQYIGDRRKIDMKLKGDFPKPQRGFIGRMTDSIFGSGSPTQPTPYHDGGEPLELSERKKPYLIPESSAEDSEYV